MKTRLLLILAILAPAVVAGQSQQPTYIVGPSDIISISVFGQPQLSARYPIEADGTFAFPLLGRVKAGGLSLRAIEDDVRSRLAGGYLRDPQVSVSVDQYRSQQVFVMGEVRQPGGLPLTGRMTLLEALARAGSTTDKAAPEAVIVRAAATAPDAGPAAPPTAAADGNVVRISLDSLQNGALSQNVALQAGDTVFVPRMSTIFVSGHVNHAGEYVLRSGMTVRQALALAGGVTDRGSMRRVQLIRQANGAEVKTDAKLGDVVEAGDTIFVRERFF